MIGLSSLTGRLTWRGMLALGGGLVVVGLLCVEAVRSNPPAKSGTGQAVAKPSTQATASTGPRTGAQIYAAQCASCHGDKGEGIKGVHAEPLLGDKSVLELTRLITKTMPKDAVGTCTGKDAEEVAKHIHETFYSPAAQARHKPARVELSRLTVRQYRQAVADVVGGFRTGGSTGRGPGEKSQPGLKAEYYKGRGIRTNERVLERIDPQVNFDFGEKSAVPEQPDPHTFSARWEGSVYAPETGEYEFILHTQHATRLWVNQTRTPLIDAWVKSGSDTEYRQTLFLLGGRHYPLRLEYSKAKQGVDDSKKNMPKSQASSIKLHWKRPQQLAEPIPARVLSTRRGSEVFVCATPFPPDDRSVGYERGTSVSKAWDTATTEAAIETATYLGERLNELSGTKDGAKDRDAKVREFCVRFVERAFRQPLNPAQLDLYVERHFKGADTVENAVRRVLLLALKSPRFLYRELGDPTADRVTAMHQTAARLSFALWDSIPDPALSQAAAKGELGTREQVLAQARRMLNDERTRAKLREFFWAWTKADQVADLAKDPAKFGEFTPQVVADLRTSLELFLDEIVWSDTSDFRRLVMAEEVPLNGRLAKFFGIEGSDDLGDDVPFEMRPLDPGQRAGVLTHPYLLASFAYTATSSPIHRGVFISRSLLGRRLRPPPDAVTPFAPELHANLTTRERIALQTRADNCMACHGMINPLGYALEAFDAVGRLRANENGRPLDVTGGYITRHGNEVKFTGSKELAHFLVENDETRAAIVEQLFQYLIKQPLQAYGKTLATELETAFEKESFHLRHLAAEIAARTALPSVPQAENNPITTSRSR